MNELTRRIGETDREYLTRAAVYIAKLKNDGNTKAAEEASYVAFWEIYDTVEEMVKGESRLYRLDEKTQEKYMDKMMSVVPKILYKYNNPDYIDEKYEGKQFKVKTFLKSRTRYCIRESLAAAMEISNDDAKILLKIRSARLALAREHRKAEYDISAREIYLKLNEEFTEEKIRELLILEKGKESFDLVTEQGVENFTLLNGLEHSQGSYDIDKAIFGEILDEDAEEALDSVFGKMSKLEILLLMKKYGLLGHHLQVMELKPFSETDVFKKYFAEDASIKSRKDPVKTAYNKNQKIEKAIDDLKKLAEEKHFYIESGLERYLFRLLDEK